MLAGCNEIKADSIKTSHGTVMKRLSERYTCSDRDNFNKFVLEHGTVELFEGRIHQSNFKEFISERNNSLHEAGLPPVRHRPAAAPSGRASPSRQMKIVRPPQGSSLPTT
jgi:hypothetical protein